MRERGEAGCPSDNFAPLRLECGEKGLSCVPETGEEGWGAISRVMLLFFFVRPAVLKVAKGCSFFLNLSPPTAVLTFILIWGHDGNAAAWFLWAAFSFTDCMRVQVNGFESKHKFCSESC